MRITTVTCDGCGNDLTTRTNIVDYRLVLAPEDMPGYGAGAYTAMGKYPAVDRAHHFCGLRCLDQWSDHRRLYDKLRKEKSDKWADEHGKVIGTAGLNNRPLRSYPAPPDEVQTAWHAECEAAADAEFPLIKKR